MALHPQTVAWLDALSGLPKMNFADLTAQEFRDIFAAPAPEPSVQVARVESINVDLGAGERELRFYYPNAEAQLPVTVFFHGGGFVIGGPDMTDEMCRTLANASAGVVVSVDYRLAPEFAFPAGLEDAAAAVSYVFDHALELGVARGAIAVAGDSSGGNFAAALAQMSRDGHLPPLCHQVLLYPVLDATCSSASHVTFEEGYFLTAEMMRWYWDQYLATGGDIADPRVSPALCDDLGGLPSATIHTAEFDVLRDEGERYAQRLAQSGVPVETKRWDGQIHGFLLMQGFIDDADTALRLVGEDLRLAFSRALSQPGSSIDSEASKR